MHIAIIGAGVSGLLSALELVEHGCTVSIFDQAQAGQAASWAGGGILSPMYPWRYAEAVNTLAQYGKTEYQRYNAKISAQTGIDFEIHDTGMLIFDEEDFAVGQAYKTRFQEPMQHCELLEGAQLHQVNARLSSQLQRAMYFPELSNIRNPKLLQSLIAYLTQHPRVNFYTEHQIIRFNLQQDRVNSIYDQDGTEFFADQFVIATGAWSAHWSTQLNLDIPVEPVQGQILLFKTPADWLPTMCMNQVMYLIPRQDGHVLCGSSVRHCGFDTRTDPVTQSHILKHCLAMVPELAQFPIVKRWAGLRPGSPDGVPYIGQMPEHRNLWANFGHYRNGLCMGPASAQLLRQLMLKHDPIVDATAYSTTRLQFHKTTAPSL